MSIILDQVTYEYEAGTDMAHKAIEDVSLTIQDGEYIGLIGHTGSGKSTLTQLLNGLIMPTSGQIYYNGADIMASDFDKKKLRQKVGLVFQYPEYQLFETTVIKDVQYGPKNMGLSSLDVDMRSYEALKQVGIGDDLLDASPFVLSGGQKRRVAIAGVLAMQPEVLVLDEPTAGLDPKGCDEILDLISELRSERNMTVVLVSHSMEDVAEHVGRIIVMNQGKVVLDNVPEKVFKHYRELEAIGLSAPEVTYIIRDLIAAGVPVSHGVTTMDEAKKAILHCYKGKERH